MKIIDSEKLTQKQNKQIQGIHIKSSNPLILKALEWLEEQLSQNPYGRLSVSLEVHAGKITRIDRSVTEKIKSGGEK